VLDEIESQLQALEERYHARNVDGVHDLLRRLVDLSRKEIESRSATPEVAKSISALVRADGCVRAHLR